MSVRLIQQFLGTCPSQHCNRQEVKCFKMFFNHWDSTKFQIVKLYLPETVILLELHYSFHVLLYQIRYYKLKKKKKKKKNFIF